MGGSTTEQTTQSQSVNQLPPWVNTAAQQNYAQAQNIATQPLQQYQGQMVADVAPQMQQAWNTAAQGGNAGQPQYDAAQAGYLGVMGQAPQQVTPGQLSSTNLQPYMNPYTQSVINSTLPIMQQNLALSQNQNQDQAAAANAYGGSRMGVQQGVTQAQGALGMGQMAAQLNQANYSQAQGAAQQDIATNLQGQLANQGAQQNQAALNLQASAGLGGLGNAAQQAQLLNFGEQTTAGGLEQQQAQNQINAQIANYQQALQYPYQQLGVLQSALGMTPYETATQGQSNTTTTQQANPFTVGLGALQTAGSLFGAPAGGTSAMSGIGSMLGGLFGSDRRLKTDISKVGQHPAGVGIYSYRYKGDPKTYPKVVGPMAEDVAKIAPHAVARIPGSGGKMAVHMGALNALAPPASRRGLAFAPPGGAGPIGAGAPLMGRGVGAQLGQGRGPPAPGALSAPGVAGAIGALGSALQGAPRGMPRRARPPRLRGALGG
jgi:Chaperone of endosialidase